MKAESQILNPPVFVIRIYRVFHSLSKQLFKLPLYTNKFLRRIYLSMSFYRKENMCSGRFHTHLRDTFAPQVVRYVDLMESSIAQSLHKGFEKERWEAKG